MKDAIKQGLTKARRVILSSKTLEQLATAKCFMDLYLRKHNLVGTETERYLEALITTKIKNRV